MHKLGRSIRSVAHPAGGAAVVDLGTVTSWDYGNRTWLPIDHELRPGDVVQSQCSWNNPNGYGSTADDEMCFSFVMYYPKIQVPGWHWSLPALTSTCR